MHDKEFREMFDRDISKHKMQIIRDDGVIRHVRFKRPDTISMYFDLVTWPGILCYTGDMGTYVFQRLEDMFQFFRSDRGPGKMDLRYWAEKVQAQDKHGGLGEFSEDKARASVIENLDYFLVDNEIPKSEAKRLREEVNDALDESCDGEIAVRSALQRIDCGGMRPFDDIWEFSFQDYTHRFVWCCHAIEFGVAYYDRVKWLMTITTRTRVMATIDGRQEPGEVQGLRMGPPDYQTPEALSVRLDSKIKDPKYNGTMVLVKDIAPIKEGETR